MADISLHYRSEVPLTATVSAFGQLVEIWRRRARERRELATLDHRMIRDLGLNPGNIRFEANKPFWRD